MSVKRVIYWNITNPHAFYHNSNCGNLEKNGGEHTSGVGGYYYCNNIFSLNLIGVYLYLTKKLRLRAAKCCFGNN